MKKFILSISILIGMHSLLKNVGKLPNQLFWLSDSNLFFKVFIPLLLTSSSIVSVFQPGKVNIFVLAIVSLFVDFIYRISEVVNFLYQYIVNSPTVVAHSNPVQASVVTLKYSIVPTCIIGLIEILIIILTFRYVVRDVKFKVNS